MFRQLARGLKFDFHRDLQCFFVSWFSLSLSLSQALASPEEGKNRFVNKFFEFQA